ncbi:sensor histidine kinase [Selenihalanaerobacter shriftii]|uniref:histidine kinase n=1 Tax=Selenihalanaerobacter shriftii TaxID=142842 RepID=A0A1T4LBP8_9FIRM|nr:ATP-binding protein [Selenihalanaerobacter shriftii]SJZ51968.1 His Kinase A (phospho-acceptor) domain-containing protein [Selenihalanaerobacter shriftii]
MSLQQKNEELGILILNTDLIIQSYNAITDEFLKEKNEELIGKRITTFFNLNEKQIKINFKEDIELKIRLNDNYKLKLKVEPLLDDHSVIKGYICFCSLSFSEGLLLEKEVVAKLVHELKNPLANIKGFIQYIEHRLTDYNDEKIDKYLNLLDKEIDELNLLINRSLEYAKPENLDPELISLNEVIEDIHQLIADECHAKGIKIDYDLDKNSQGYCEHLHIKQVLLNIIKNAMDALSENTNKQIDIEIKSTQDDKYNIIIIKDNGPGIKEEYIDEVFSPFYTTKSNGNGLGLSISKEIIEKYDGKIEVDILETGTKFMIYLPTIEKN